MDQILNEGAVLIQQSIETKDPNFTLRVATAEDASLVVDFMRKLGAYQNMADEITATEAEIKRLLEENLGEAVIGSYLGKPVGFVYFCQKHQRSLVGPACL